MLPQTGLALKYFSAEKFLGLGSGPPPTGGAAPPSIPVWTN